MAYPSSARHGGPTGLAAALAKAGPKVVPDFELEGGAGPLGQAFKCDGLAVGNRFAIHPMEGWDSTLVPWLSSPRKHAFTSSM